MGLTWVIGWNEEDELEGIATLVLVFWAQVTLNEEYPSLIRCLVACCGIGMG